MDFFPTHQLRWANKMRRGAMQRVLEQRWVGLEVDPAVVPVGINALVAMVNVLVGDIEAVREMKDAIGLKEVKEEWREIPEANL